MTKKAPKNAPAWDIGFSLFVTSREVRMLAIPTKAENTIASMETWILFPKSHASLSLSISKFLFVVGGASDTFED